MVALPDFALPEGVEAFDGVLEAVLAGWGEHRDHLQGQTQPAHAADRVGELVRTLKDGIVVELCISRQPFAAPAIGKGFEGRLGAGMLDHPDIRQRPVQAGGSEYRDQRPPGDLQVLDEVKAVQLGLALGESGQMPAFRRRRTALPMRAIERAVALEHPVNRRARGKLLKRAVLLQRQADRIGPVLAQDTVLTQRPTHAQNARFDIHAYAVPGATGLTVIKVHPVKTLAPCVLYPIGHRTHTHPILHCHGAHASPRANRSNHLVTTFRNRTFLAMAHLSKMPLGYGQETGAPTRAGPHASVWRSLPGPAAARPRNLAPAA